MTQPTVVEIEVPVGNSVLLPVPNSAVVEVPVPGSSTAVEVLIAGPQGPVAQEINLLYDSLTTSYPVRPAVASVTWIGPVDPAGLAHDGDLWIDTA